MDRRDQDLALDLFHQLRRQAARGRKRPHAAGIGPFVVIEGSLVILARFQRDDRAAVGDRQHAGLLAVESLFDDQPSPAWPKMRRIMIWSMASSAWRRLSQT